MEYADLWNFTIAVFVIIGLLGIVTFVERLLTRTNDERDKTDIT